ncbi:MAG TPA: PAS domain S-box protein, partial [Armatimonadota bacterium]|nr:PAS domain S-box protein [Armatimonadota bacterium]
MADGPRDTGVSAVGAGRRMAQAAMALGALAVIGGLLVGWLGYRASLAKIELAYQAKYLDECRLLATVAREASEAHGDDDVVLAEIEAAWREDTDSAPDEYVFIVDSHSDLILHTAHPEAIGKYAGENPIVCDPDCEFVGETLAELVDLGAEHVGGYVSSAGQKQIAAFAPVPGRGWVIGVHRSDAALRSEARAGLWPAMLGYVLVCGLLIPLALGLMYQTFNRTLREREKATAELAKSAWLLGEIHDAVIGTGPAPEYPITSWNRGAGWVYGWAADEVMGKPIGEVLLTEYPNDSEREPGDGAATGEFWGHVTQAHKDGRRLTIDAHVEATRGEHGEITGWLAVNRDMTDRVEAQAALEASEERFERTLDLVPVGVGTADADGIVLTTNRRICKILGYAADELIGIHIGDLYVNADDRARVQAALVGHQAAGGIEVNLKHKDGTPVPVELHVVVVDVGGQTTRIAAIHDLTERKKADRALRESQARLAEAQRIGGIGNWSVDLKTRLVTWYEQAYRLFGLDYSADPLTQADFMAFVHPDDHHIIAEMNEAVIESDGPLVIEYRITRADGQMRWIREHVECERAHDGTPERLVGTVQDVTDERRLQDAIRGIIEGAAAATGDEFFNAMTSQLAEAIGADFTIIGEMADDTNEAVRTLSVCADGEVADNFEYDLAGTPCANVIGRDACVYEEGVADEFPEDHLLREMGVE